MPVYPVSGTEDGSREKIEEKMLQTQKLVLIIKARSESEAIQAANSRGLSLTDLSPSEFNSYRARTDAANLIKVQHWYNEPGDIIPGLGYFWGTLLYFNTGA
jgi:hypothetical protein